jgi:hypothetical protein
MRLRSRGLGRKELVLDFREYAVVREGEEIVVVGTIRDPVNWDFSIRICEDDVAGMLRLASRRATLGLLLRSLFRRRRRHHWSDERAAHLAEGRARLASACVKAEERSRLGREADAARAPRARRGAPSAVEGT